MLFEALMLICFGAAWPMSVYKSHKTRSNEGKSIAFLFTIFIGYVAGILHKIFYNYDWVLYLYLFNQLFVILDIILFFRNKNMI